MTTRDQCKLRDLQRRLAKRLNANDVDGAIEVHHEIRACDFPVRASRSSASDVRNCDICGKEFEARILSPMLRCVGVCAAEGKRRAERTGYYRRAREASDEKGAPPA